MGQLDHLRLIQKAEAEALSILEAIKSILRAHKLEEGV